MSTVAAHPRVVATVGLHGSASTWVFNVVREMMIESLREENVLALVADKLEELPHESTRADRQLVVKSHHGSAGLDAWLSAAKTQLVLSIRDPRDACISMSQRFKAPLGAAANWLANDCARMLRLATDQSLLLRYEDRFFDNPETIIRLVKYLGIRPAATATDEIFARYRTAAVRSFAQRLQDLPPERIASFGSSHLVDRVTQFHGVHIGDGISGKWRFLVKPLQSKLTGCFCEFLDRFGYPR